MAAAAVIQLFQDCANKKLNQTLKTPPKLSLLHFMLVIFENVYAVFIYNTNTSHMLLPEHVLGADKNRDLVYGCVSEGGMEKNHLH